MTDHIQLIKNEAISLEVGSTLTVPCCFCGKPKLSITRMEEGIVYNCWSAACSGKGFIGSLPSHFMEVLEKAPFQPKPYKGATTVIESSRTMLDILEHRYNLRSPSWLGNGWKKVFGTEAMVMPLFSGDGKVYGTTTKHFGRVVRKAIHYLSEKNCMNHYAKPQDLNHKAVLVEDVISAARICQDVKGWTGVALLGTDLNDDKIKDLLKYGYNNVIIALDPDATVKGLEYTKKYGLFFKTCRAVVLSADPKDLTKTELNEQLSEEIT